MSWINFEEVNSIRLKSEVSESINKIIRAYKGKYDNKSHFIRCAINKLIREELEFIKNSKRLKIK